MRLNSIVVILLSIIAIIMTTIIAGGGAAFSTTTVVDPTHCDQPGFPSCYSIGYQAGKKATSSGAACVSGHSKNYCAGYEAGTRSCDRSGGSDKTKGSGSTSSRAKNQS